MDSKKLQKLSLQMNAQALNVDSEFALEFQFVSRSDAKRIATEFAGFDEVELDFANVDQIGRPFADELVRVWLLAHPYTRITIINASDDVTKTLLHPRGRLDLPQPENAVKFYPDMTILCFTCRPCGIMFHARNV
jgi:hypothetical protein